MHLCKITSDLCYISDVPQYDTVGQVPKLVTAAQVKPCPIKAVLAAVRAASDTHVYKCESPVPTSVLRENPQVPVVRLTKSDTKH